MNRVSVARFCSSQLCICSNLQVLMNREVIVNAKQALVNRGEREVRVLCYHCQERCRAQEWNEREAF